MGIPWYKPATNEEDYKRLTAYPPLGRPSPNLLPVEISFYRAAVRADDLLRVCLSTSPTPDLVVKFEKECVEIEDLVKGECADAAREQLLKTDYLAFEGFKHRTLQLIQIWMKGGEGASGGLFKPLILDPSEVLSRTAFFQKFERSELQRRGELIDQLCEKSSVLTRASCELK
jgi:hypothetical protein